MTLPQLIIQPAGSRAALDHLERTILNSVNLATLARHVPPAELEVLNRLYPGGSVHVWGMTDGVGGSIAKKWAQITPGDIVLFSSMGRYMLHGTVTSVQHNEALAKELWGVDEAGQTWKNVYFVDEIRPIDIQYASVNSVLGYRTYFVSHGVIVVSEDKANAVFVKHELANPRTVHETSERILDAHMPLESQVTILARREQAALRDRLLGGKAFAQCGVCGRAIPRALLIAGHIKRRESCNPNEKRDPNVAMLVCSLGCDALFEHGYISVQGGAGRHS